MNKQLRKKVITYSVLACSIIFLIAILSFITPLKKWSIVSLLLVSLISITYSLYMFKLCWKESWKQEWGWFKTWILVLLVGAIGAVFGVRDLIRWFSQS